MIYTFLIVCFFFFQAEDGIRDLTVTGVQTCALPIFAIIEGDLRLLQDGGAERVKNGEVGAPETDILEGDGLQLIGGRKRDPIPEAGRSEERRVGKGGRTRGAG